MPLTSFRSIPASRSLIFCLVALAAFAASCFVALVTVRQRSNHAVLLQRRAFEKASAAKIEAEPAQFQSLTTVPTPEDHLPDCECDKCDPSGGGALEWGWGSYDPVTGIPRIGCVDTVVKANYARYFDKNGTEVVAPINRFYGSKMFPPKGPGLSEPGYLPEQQADALCSQQSGLHEIPEDLKGIVADKDKGCPDPCAYSPCNIGESFTVQCPRHCFHYFGAVRGEKGSGGHHGPYGDFSSICRSAIFAGYGVNDDSFYATFRIVAPKKEYSNLRYEQKFTYYWDYADDPERIAAAGKACCVGGWPPKLGDYNPTALYRQDFKNEWQNVRAYVFEPSPDPCGGGCQCPTCEDKCNCNPKKCQGCMKDDCYECPDSPACEDPCADKCKCDPDVCGPECRKFAPECAPCYDKCKCVPGDCLGCKAGEPVCEPCKDPCDCHHHECQGCHRGEPMCIPCEDKCDCKEGDCLGCVAGQPECEPCKDVCSCEPGECKDCIAGTPACEPCPDPCDCEEGECLDCKKSTAACEPCLDPCDCTEGSCLGCVAGTAACEPCPDPCACKPGECLDCHAGTSACDPCEDRCFCEPGNCQGCEAGTDACADCVDECNCKHDDCPLCKSGNCEVCPDTCEDCEDECDCDPMECNGCVKFAPECQPCEDPCACKVGECRDCAVGTAACDPCEDPCACTVGECLGCEAGTPACEPCDDPCDCKVGECKDCAAETAACQPCADKCDCTVGECVDCAAGTGECSGKRDIPEPCEDPCNCDADTCSGCLQGQPECDECPSGTCFSSSGKSLINMHCKTWRDERITDSTHEQKRVMAKCMAQDCAQSLEQPGWSSAGCRYMDSNGFCYAYQTAQQWCTPGNVYCNDRVGPQSALEPIGSIPTESSEYDSSTAHYFTEWMPMYNVQVDHPQPGDTPYNCTCVKNCGCTDEKCWCNTNFPNGPFGYDDYFDTLVANAASSSSKKGECACACGDVLGA